MSALTKVFVILLVVCSLLLSAGLIVFVNRVENLRASQDAAVKRAVAVEAQARQDVARAQAAQVAAEEALRTAQSQIQIKDNALLAAQKALADKQVEIATLSKTLASQSLDLRAATEAAQAAQQQASQLQTEIAQLRNTTNEILVQNAQLHERNSELTNQLEATERARKYLAEELAQTQQTASTYRGMLEDAGINVQTASSALRAGAPAIRGVITEKRTIAGRPYATISVGSADAVRRGMEFKVIDRQNASFLGTLVVEAVEANEASGRLTGPRVDDIRPGSEVTTQIRG